MTIRPALRVVTDAASLEALLDIAQEAENRQFSGLYVPSSGNTYKEFCRAALEATGSIIVSTSIVPIYRQPAVELASFAAELHDLSGGRFRLGLGVSHAGVLKAAGIDVGNPLSDMRAYIGDLHEVADKNGLTLPPIYLATLRNGMLKLADEIADGAICGMGALSHMARQFDETGVHPSDSFFIGNMAATILHDDPDTVIAIHRAANNFYLRLPNYRNYWREAGYRDQVQAVEDALARGQEDSLVDLLGPEWLNDVSYSGTAVNVRKQVEATMAIGITPIMTPTSAHGDTLAAFKAVMALFD